VTAPAHSEVHSVMTKQRARPQAGRGWIHVERSASWLKAQAVVGGGIADHMQADRFVRIELRTLRTHLT